jgi:hypothetical protein
VKETTNTKKYKTYYMDLSNVENLEKHEKETGAKKSTLVNMALKEFFEKRGLGAPQNLTDK